MYIGNDRRLIVTWSACKIWGRSSVTRAPSISCLLSKTESATVEAVNITPCYQKVLLLGYIRHYKRPSDGGNIFFWRYCRAKYHDLCGGGMFRGLDKSSPFCNMLLQLAAWPSDVGNIFFRRYCRAKYHDLCSGSMFRGLDRSSPFWNMLLQLATWLVIRIMTLCNVQCNNVARLTIFPIQLQYCELQYCITILNITIQYRITILRDLSCKIILPVSRL